MSVDTRCNLGENQQVIHSFDDNAYVNLCCMSPFPRHSVLISDKQGLLKIKDSLINGVKHPHCEGCWHSERQGLKSYRQIMNENKNVGTNYRMEIYFDNTCDLACVYCNASYSSKWEDEYRKAPDEDKKILKIVGPDNENFKSSRKLSENNFDAILDNIADVGKLSHPGTYIMLLGGETLLTPFLKDNLIKRVIESFYSTASHDRYLMVTLATNGNTPDSITDKAIKAVNDMKSIYPNLEFNICFSIESVGKVAEYVRYGLSWEQFDKNVNKWVATDHNIQFNLALNNMSFFSTPDCLEYIFDKARNRHKTKASFQFAMHLVNTPALLSISILPNEYAYVFDKLEQITRENEGLLRKADFNEVLQSITSYRPYLGPFPFFKHEPERAIKAKQDLIKYVEYIQRTRGLLLADINPILHEYLSK